MTMMMPLPATRKTRIQLTTVKTRREEAANVMKAAEAGTEDCTAVGVDTAAAVGVDSMASASSVSVSCPMSPSSSSSDSPATTTTTPESSTTTATTTTTPKSGQRRRSRTRTRRRTTTAAAAAAAARRRRLPVPVAAAVSTAAGLVALLALLSLTIIIMTMKMTLKVKVTAFTTSTPPTAPTTTASSTLANFPKNIYSVNGNGRRTRARRRHRDDNERLGLGHGLGGSSRSSFSLLAVVRSSSSSSSSSSSQSKPTTTTTTDSSSSSQQSISSSSSSSTNKGSGRRQPQQQRQQHGRVCHQQQQQQHGQQRGRDGNNSYLNPRQQQQQQRGRRRQNVAAAAAAQQQKTHQRHHQQQDSMIRAYQAIQYYDYVDDYKPSYEYVDEILKPILDDMYYQSNFDHDEEDGDDETEDDTDLDMDLDLDYGIDSKGTAVPTSSSFDQSSLLSLLFDRLDLVVLDESRPIQERTLGFLATLLPMNNIATTTRNVTVNNNAAVHGEMDEQDEQQQLLHSSDNARDRIWSSCKLILNDMVRDSYVASPIPITALTKQLSATTSSVSSSLTMSSSSTTSTRMEIPELLQLVHEMDQKQQKDEEGGGEKAAVVVDLSLCRLVGWNMYLSSLLSIDEMNDDNNNGNGGSSRDRTRKNKNKKKANNNNKKFIVNNKNNGPAAGTDDDDDGDYVGRAASSSTDQQHQLEQRLRTAVHLLRYQSLPPLASVPLTAPPLATTEQSVGTPSADSSGASTKEQSQNSTKGGDGDVVSHDNDVDDNSVVEIVVDWKNVVILDVSSYNLVMHIAASNGFVDIVDELWNDLILKQKQYEKKQSGNDTNDGDDSNSNTTSFSSSSLLNSTTVISLRPDSRTYNARLKATSDPRVRLQIWDDEIVPAQTKRNKMGMGMDKESSLIDTYVVDNMLVPLSQAGRVKDIFDMLDHVVDMHIMDEQNLSLSVDSPSPSSYYKKKKHHRDDPRALQKAFSAFLLRPIQDSGSSSSRNSGSSTTSILLDDNADGSIVGASGVDLSRIIFDRYIAPSLTITEGGSSSEKRRRIVLADRRHFNILLEGYSRVLDDEILSSDPLLDEIVLANNIERREAALQTGHELFEMMKKSAAQATDGTTVRPHNNNSVRPDPYTWTTMTKFCQTGQEVEELLEDAVADIVKRNKRGQNNNNSSNKKTGGLWRSNNYKARYVDSEGNKIEIPMALIRATITACGVVGDPSRACTIFHRFVLQPQQQQQQPMQRQQYRQNKRRISSIDYNNRKDDSSPRLYITDTRTTNVLLGALAECAKQDSNRRLSMMESSSPSLVKDGDNINEGSGRDRSQSSSPSSVSVFESVLHDKPCIDAALIIFNAMSSKRNIQTYMFVASALQYHESPSSPKESAPEELPIPIALLRNATEQDNIVVDGKLVNAAIRIWGDDISGALNHWKTEIRNYLAQSRRSFKSGKKGQSPTMSKFANMLAAYNGLLYVCGRALRPDIAVRIVYAMKKEGLFVNEQAFQNYKSGTRRREQLLLLQGPLRPSSDKDGQKTTSTTTTNPTKSNDDNARLTTSPPSSTTNFLSKLTTKLSPTQTTKKLKDYMVSQYESVLYVECKNFDVRDKRTIQDPKIKIIV